MIILILQSILTFRSAIQGVIDDMVLEELELLVTECFTQELQHTDVVKDYENLMPLDEYCTLMDELYEQKQEHVMVRKQKVFPCWHLLK